MPVYNCPLICMLVRFGRVLPGVATQPLCTSTLWEDTWPWTSVASEGHFPQRVSWVVRPKVPIWGSPQRATYCIGSTMKCMEALYQHKQMQLYSYMHHYASPFEYTTTIYKFFQMILHDLTLQVQAICCSQKKRGPYQPSSCRGRVGDGPWDPKKAVISVTGQHKFCSHNTSCTLFHWLPLQGPQTTCSNSNQHTWSTISDPGCLRMLSSSRPCTGLVWMLFNKPYGLELPQKRAESRQLLGTHLPLQKQNFGRAQVKLMSLLWEIYYKHMIHII